ncbi:MAG TPA: hypothetical protein VM367_17035 [Pseudonocardia sp.]|nr:hypothetical protein [Pseudonocardia sp.]
MLLRLGHGSRPTPPSASGLGPAARAALVARWPLGVARVTWRYLWRTTPMRRSEQAGGAADLPEPVPSDCCDERVQHADEGVGPLLHRRYAVRIREARVTPEEVVAGLADDPNSGAPQDIAVFVKTRGEAGVLAVGDEFVVRMPGPWDGPVRVIGRGPLWFRLATLRGHLEAGQIEFRARGEDGLLHVEIESWARAGDRLAHLAYNRLRVAKEIQLNLWVETLLAMTASSGGRRDGLLRVDTRWVEVPA